MVTIVCYTCHASTALAIGGHGYWDTLWSDQQHKVKHQQEENVYSLTLQWNIYLQEIHKAFETIFYVFRGSKFNQIRCSKMGRSFSIRSSIPSIFCYIMRVKYICNEDINMFFFYF